MNKRDEEDEDYLLCMDLNKRDGEDYWTVKTKTKTVKTTGL